MGAATSQAQQPDISRAVPKVVETMWNLAEVVHYFGGGHFSLQAGLLKGDAGSGGKPASLVLKGCSAWVRCADWQRPDI